MVWVGQAAKGGDGWVADPGEQRWGAARGEAAAEAHGPQTPKGLRLELRTWTLILWVVGAPEVELGNSQGQVRVSD